MRIVITGASGSVGTALLRALAVDGAEHHLTGVVRRPPKPAGVYRDVSWVELDVADPQADTQLTRVFDGADAVVHLAWGFQPTHNTGYLMQVGVGGTASVLTAAHAAQVGLLVHMSSVGTYAAGRYGQRVDESWSTRGIATSPYSQDKAAAEQLFDDYESRYGDRGVPVTRLRPGFIVQRSAASGLARYGLPAYLPMRAVSLLPLLPVDGRLCIPLIHADDVADALVRALHQSARGAFNLSTEPPLRQADAAAVLGAKPVHLPARISRLLVSASWRARLQPIDEGWLDLAFSVPLLDCTRARDILGWSPYWSSTEALSDVLSGFADHAYAASPPLRPRSLLELIRRAATEGTISRRRLP